ncbi:GTP-binding protein [Paenibacillus sp. OSY-SE]|uniref:GTP-binding protein n=1 Tax=Paenibacillus sp. OSY-SE TaxID=1196323 RepID=UPI0002FE45CC|nr:TetM/TetW/TetO/TetS family tetracycline resistance ribosomal protection protein [Paenibacillus sp. OSY-SE]
MAKTTVVRRNVGVFAHVDAGKTTTTEHMLYESGQIRALGSVDAGTAQTDWLDVERERGISVRAATTTFHWRNAAINMVDTPGHVDFLSEVERSLHVMDGAVLIVSAVEGVQAQTEIIWQALRSLNIPTIIYVNKMDRIGADADTVLLGIRKYLTAHAVPIQSPAGREDSFLGGQDLWGADPFVPEEERKQLIEAIAECDEGLLERYLNGENVNVDEWKLHLTALTHRCELFPVLFGASSKGIGVSALMDAVVDYLPDPSGTLDAPLSGIVFKIERDKTMGRMAYVRLFNGIIHNRDVVFNDTLGVEEKVTQIRKVDGHKAKDTGMLEAGDIAAVCGMHRVRIGDVLGCRAGVKQAMRLAVPLLKVQVHWANEQDYPRTVAALQELADEDPLLDLQWLQDERELHLKVMGPIQLEIMSSLLHTRFGLDVTFGQPSVIYKETPKHEGEGFIAYTMPKPCWAVLRFKIEPGPCGSGLQYDSQVRAENLLPQYQNEVARRVPQALQQGLHGWEVVDLKVTLIEGEHHVWHTHPLDFAVATPMGIMDGLVNTETRLLEPMLQFRITVPEEFGGKIMNDLVQMRGVFEAPVPHGGRMTLEGRMPAATSLDYPIKLGSMTKGRGTIATFFDRYEQCPPDISVTCPRRGVNPLDQSKYILSVRKALQS